MTSKFLVVIVASCISSILYRAGGMSKELSTKPKWIPEWMRNTRVRDIGCSAVTCLLAGYLLSWHWTLILCFGLMWGAISMYWKFGHRNSKWFNWLAVGIGYSVAMLPYVIAEGLWFGFISRTIVLGATTMIWSELIDNDVKEELGRGALITLTMILFII